MQALVEYNEGDEVYNTYGDLPNSHLLIGYGFAIDDNVNDTIQIEVSLNEKDEVYAGKKKIT